jgi:hypothetical protein
VRLGGTIRSSAMCQPALSISTIACAPGATAWVNSARSRHCGRSPLQPQNLPSANHNAPRRNPLAESASTQFGISRVRKSWTRRRRAREISSDAHAMPEIIGSFHSLKYTRGRRRDELVCPTRPGRLSAFLRQPLAGFAGAFPDQGIRAGPILPCHDQSVSEVTLRQVKNVVY